MVQQRPADGHTAYVDLWTLRQQVDRAALEAVAQVTEAKDAFKIALREGQGLDDLELALLPVLPVESVRVHKR